MRIRSILAALAVLSAVFITSPQPASAGFFYDHGGWGRERVVTHRVYAPRYSHRYYNHAATDPYYYRYVQPRYYPAYNTHYWVPARCYRKCRSRYDLPRYYRAWGYPKHCKSHRGCKTYHHRHHHRYHHHRR